MTEWDLKKLRVLRTLADAGTVTATAEALFLTPSAVSQQLSSLAQQLGVPLLEAHGRRVRLTPAAHLVLRHTDGVFAELERADAALAGHRGGEIGEVRLAAFATAVPALVVPAVAALRRDHPGLSVSVREAEAAEAYELLASRGADLALSLAAHAPPAAGGGTAGGGADGGTDGVADEGPDRGPFTRLALHADPLDVALPAGHRLAGGASVRLRDLAGEPWIFGHSGPWSQITRSVCEGAGFAPRQAHAAADWPAILALVGAGMGVALVPRMASAARRGAEGVAVLPVAGRAPTRQVVVAMRRGAEQWPGLDRMIEALRNVQVS